MGVLLTSPSNPGFDGGGQPQGEVTDRASTLLGFLSKQPSSAWGSCMSLGHCTDRPSTLAAISSPDGGLPPG